MNILSFISGIFKPVAQVVDDLQTSDEEKLRLQNSLSSIQNEMAAKVLDYEKQLAESQSEIIKAEATGHSWMQRNWRPITMFTFLFLVVLDSFGFLTNPLAPEAWTLLQIGLGGYVIGRSFEKAGPAIVEAVKRKRSY